MATDNKLQTEPGTYDHTEEHTKVISLTGVTVGDTEIGRAWARLYDRGWNAGPAVAAPFMKNDHEEVQYFQYAIASRDTDERNKNLTVHFNFHGITVSESGL